MIKLLLPSLTAMLLTVGLATAEPPASQPASRPIDAGDTTVARPKGGKLANYFLRLHQEFLDRDKQGNIDVVFLGDSITRKWRDAPEIWKNRYEPINAVNFGIMGDVIQHVLWRVEHGELDGIRPKVVVLLIGTNNSNRKGPGPIVTGIKHLIDVIHERCPSTKVLLMGIFPRDKPEDKYCMQIINAVNPELAKLDNGKSVRFLNINDKFETPDGKLRDELFADRLHPNPAGYQVWADAMQPLLKEMLQD